LNESLGHSSYSVDVKSFFRVATWKTSSVVSRDFLAESGLDFFL